MSFSAFNSPATQANSTPLTGSKSTPRKQQPSEDAIQRANLLKTIDNLETLPTFLSLPSTSPLRQLLAPFLVAVRARLSCASAAPSSLESRLEKLESLISGIDKKITPEGQRTYA
jgi:hypothetical protein